MNGNLICCGQNLFRCLLDNLAIKQHASQLEFDMNHLNEILTPISGDQLCGKNLSYSKEFDDLAELRREDEPLLSQGNWVAPLKTAQWGEVQKRCTALLVNTSKDLRLAVWLTEACTVNHGYPGMRYGLEVCAQLCARYWNEMHPQIEAGDVDERVGHLSRLLQRLSVLTRAVPITSGDQGVYSLSDIDHASAQPAGADPFNLAWLATPKPALLETLKDLAACQTALMALQTEIDLHLGSQGPSFVSAREALESAAHEVGRWTGEPNTTTLTGHSSSKSSVVSPIQKTPEPKNTTATDLNLTSATPQPQAPSTPTGPLRSREQALLQLRQVAHFFRTTEPHSPVAYLADKAAQWGEMALHDWLRAVVKEGTSLAQLEELLGVPAKRD
jgi:type VI secretion system protein ImpA